MKSEKQKYCADQLEYESAYYNRFQNAARIDPCPGTQCLRQTQPVMKRQPRPGHDEQRGGERHYPQPAQLYQNHDNELPEPGEILPGIDHRQTGDAYRRGRRKQGVDQGNGPFGGADRQIQQYRSRRDGDQKIPDSLAAGIGAE